MSPRRRRGRIFYVHNTGEEKWGFVIRDGKWENLLYRLDYQKTKKQSANRATNKEQSAKNKKATNKIKKGISIPEIPFFM